MTKRLSVSEETYWLVKAAAARERCSEGEVVARALAGRVQVAADFPRPDRVASPLTAQVETDRKEAPRAQSLPPPVQARTPIPKSLSARRKGAGVQTADTPEEVRKRLAELAGEK